ncbi:inositol monophosphatase [Candidatus Woesearchaeota archaeon]|nr:inositol monophosphatase [Candidatus Woesearchaeota archaeon]
MKFKDVGIRAAKEAGRLIMKHYGRKKVSRFKSPDQIVTTVDEQSQKRIAEIILSSFPGHGIIGEESLNIRKSSPFKWYIDPIDGTNNFIHDMPYFCVSIALQKDKEMILGIVYDPCTKNIFVAEKGKGATLNGKRMRVSNEKRLSSSLLIFDAAIHRDTVRKLKDLEAISSKFFRIRMFGAAALDLANVARGVADASITYKINSWDIAAGCLIVEEAGGKATDFNGSKWHPEMGCVVASNRGIHNGVLRVVNDGKLK